MKPTCEPRRSWRRGFTLIELLVVIAIIGILAGMLLPALAKAKGSAQRAKCLGNLKQVLLSTQLYVDDWEGIMPYTSWSSDTYNKANWCYTRTTDRTNKDNVELGQLWPYHKSKSLYWCPVEQTNNAFFRARDMQVCSYVMNGSISAFTSSSPPLPKPFVSFKQSSFKAHYMLYWEPDERVSSYYDNVASNPSEGCSLRHSSGIVMALLGGSTEFIKNKVYWSELNIPKNRGGRLWVNPVSLDGH
jgi:prepilin-type N-terminal cleavage/methylation domain-containing protein